MTDSIKPENKTKHEHENAHHIATTHSSNDAKVHSKYIRYKNLLRNQRALVLIVVLVLAGIGIAYYALASSFVVAAAEAEQMTLPVGASIVSDSTAGAGKAVKFTYSTYGTSVLNGNVNLNSNVDTISIIAKGSKCRGYWPVISVSVDGVRILSNKTISNTAWQATSIPKNLSLGSHTVAVSAANISRCGNLYVDKMIFYGQNVAPAVPSVTVSANPSTVNQGGSSTITWNSTNATVCHAGGAWTGDLAISGTYATGQLIETSTFWINCQGEGGQLTNKVTVTVLPGNTAASDSIAQMRPKVLALAVDTQNLLATKSDANDTSYYSAGQYYSADMSNPTVLLGPATEAAALWVETGRTNMEYYHRAVDAFDLAVATYQNANGSIGDPTSPDSQFYGNELGKIYYYLKNDLDATHKANWQSSLSRVADFLVTNHNITFYTNGNVVLGQTMLYWLTWNATGLQKYKDYFEQQYAFMITPTSPTWDGYGLKYSVTPTKADGSDGAGYLTEQGAGDPGYDGDYTHFQLDEAADLYMLSGDVRFLRLANLFFNQIIPHVDQTTWVLDATNGSRHSLSFPVYTGGMMVLAWKGGRDDLIPKIPDQFTKAMYSTFYGNAVQNWGSGGIYRTYGSSVVMTLAASHIDTLPGAGAK